MYGSLLIMDTVNSLPGGSGKHQFKIYFRKLLQYLK